MQSSLVFNFYCHACCNSGPSLVALIYWVGYSYITQIFDKILVMGGRGSLATNTVQTKSRCRAVEVAVENRTSNLQNK